MTADPRVALNAFIAALERQLEAVSGSRGEDDPKVAAANDTLADAFEAYDDALFEKFGTSTPLDIYSGDDDFDDEDDLDEDDDFDDDLDLDDEDSTYGGLDDDEYDEDDLDDEASARS